jgi:hypothetical protein
MPQVVPEPQDFTILAPVKDRPSVTEPSQDGLPRNSSMSHHVRYTMALPSFHQVQEFWNWKSALLSAVLRALVFLAINWTAGWRSAGSAMAVEFVYRILTSGFYGSLIQRFRAVEPAWRAAIYVVLLLPALNQGLDLLVHWLNGTPKLAASVIASSVITVWAALFNLYAMRQGALVAGRDGRPFRDDLLALPALVGGFFLIVPRLVWKGAK